MEEGGKKFIKIEKQYGWKVKRRFLQDVDMGDQERVHVQNPEAGSGGGSPPVPAEQEDTETEVYDSMEGDPELVSVLQVARRQYGRSKGSAHRESGGC